MQLLGPRTIRIRRHEDEQTIGRLGFRHDCFCRHAFSSENVILILFFFLSSVTKALLTRHAPYSNMSNFTVSLTIHRGSLPDFSVETLQSFDFRIIALRQISFECWNLDPNKRPDMSLISSAMESASKFG